MSFLQAVSDAGVDFRQGSGCLYSTCGEREVSQFLDHFPKNFNPLRILLPSGRTRGTKSLVLLCHRHPPSNGVTVSGPTVPLVSLRSVSYRGPKRNVVVLPRYSAGRQHVLCGTWKRGLCAGGASSCCSSIRNNSMWLSASTVPC